MSQPEMASNLINWDMEKFLLALNRETNHALNAMQSHLQQLRPAKRNEFKISFLKSANYQLMAAYERFEMNLMMNEQMNHTRNSFDFRLMPPPNMPFVVSDERMPGRTASKSNGMPVLLDHDDSSDRNMDLECDQTYRNADTIKANGVGGIGSSTNTNDRMVFRTSGVNLTNGYVRNGNEYLSDSNDSSGPSRILNSQFKASNGHESTSNTVQRVSMDINAATMMNRHGHEHGREPSSEDINGFSSGSTTVASSISNGHYNAEHNHGLTDMENIHRNVSAITYESLFWDDSNGSPNDSIATNNVSDNHIHQSHITNSHRNDSNVTHSDAGSGLFGKITRLIGTKNSSNDRQGSLINNSHSVEVSNGHEKTPSVSNFPHFNYNSNDIGRNDVIEVNSNPEMHGSSSKERECDAVSLNNLPLDVNDSEFDDDRFDNDLCDAIYASDDDDDDGEQNTNFGRKNFNDTLELTGTPKQQTNVANLFETTPFLANNGDGNESAIANKRFETLSERPQVQTSSDEFQRFQFSSSKSSKREWMCFYCFEARKRNIEDFICSTVDEIYDHWKQNHLNDDDDTDTDASDDGDANKNQNPFRFYSIDLLYCAVDSCWHCSTFQGLHRHHQKKHPKNLFVPIFNSRCAMCLHTGAGDGDLREHSCDLLQHGIQLRLYNPILLTDYDLMELQAIRSQGLEQNRAIKIGCQQCGCIFGSRQEMTRHYHEKYSAGTINSSEIIKAAVLSEVIALICNCCQSEIQPNDLIDHIMSKAKKCWRKDSIPLTWDGWFHRQEIHFLKTKVIFSNGLVLFKQNLIVTELGNYAEFTKIAKQIFDSLKSNGMEKEGKR